jgi:hypothetical protein
MAKRRLAADSNGTGFSSPKQHLIADRFERTAHMKIYLPARKIERA